ncbi:MAG TPA: hypothetical protein VHG70_04345 [Nocardioidaceae bacterium]|nr:hypothetical protein [Nocardioidaceae bacterium]
MSTPGRTVKTAPVLLLVLTLAACTGGAEKPEGAAPATPSTPSATATESQPSLRERAEPYDVRLGKVAGRIPRHKRARFRRSLSRPVRAWVDAGFVAGPWPRQGFRAAFGPFAGGITQRAGADVDLLTLKSVGSSLTQVVPERRRIVLSVTEAGGHVVGATARVDVRVLGVDRGDGRQRVHVRGELYLTPTQSHGWKIFGYELDRWVEQGAMTAPSSATRHRRRQ